MFIHDYVKGHRPTVKERRKGHRPTVKERKFNTLQRHLKVT